MIENEKIDKDELVRMLAKKAGFNLGDTRDLLDGLIDILEEVVEEKREFNIRGFGKIVYSRIKARTTPHPRTGIPTNFPEAYRIRFSFSKNILGK